AALTLAVIGLFLLTRARTLDAFAFGDTAASSLGVHVQATRWVMLTLTALLVGAMVAVSGSIGFIGLVIPHVVRLLLGARHTRLLPASALIGALFLLWADTGARSFFAPAEVPVGILTAALGAPVFAWLLMRHRSRTGAVNRPWTLRPAARCGARTRPMWPSPISPPPRWAIASIRQPCCRGWACACVPGRSPGSSGRTGRANPRC